MQEASHSQEQTGTPMTSAFEILREGLEVTDIDRSIMKLRMKPLSESELASLRRKSIKMPSVYPYFSIEEIRVNGKLKHIPFVGIKGTF